MRNGDATCEPVGDYSYQKKQATGWEIPVKTLVYSVAVKDISEVFPEAHERDRKWVDAKAAAELVNEAELKSIFRSQ